jgi:hypothetical protein
MTDLQKFIITQLLLGYHIVGQSNYGYRLLDPKKNCVRRFHYNTLLKLKPLMRYRGGAIHYKQIGRAQAAQKSFCKEDLFANVEASKINQQTFNGGSTCKH